MCSPVLQEWVQTPTQQGFRCLPFRHTYLAGVQVSLISFLKFRRWPDLTAVALSLRMFPYLCRDCGIPRNHHTNLLYKRTPHSIIIMNFPRGRYGFLHLVLSITTPTHIKTNSVPAHQGTLCLLRKKGSSQPEFLQSPGPAKVSKPARPSGTPPEAASMVGLGPRTRGGAPGFIRVRRSPYYTPRQRWCNSTPLLLLATSEDFFHNSSNFQNHASAGS